MATEVIGSTFEDVAVVGEEIVEVVPRSGTSILLALEMGKLTSSETVDPEREVDRKLVDAASTADEMREVTVLGSGNGDLVISAVVPSEDMAVDLIAIEESAEDKMIGTLPLLAGRAWAPVPTFVARLGMSADLYDQINFLEEASNGGSLEIVGNVEDGF